MKTKGHVCSVKGRITELRVAADLMRRGFEVFDALSPVASCDLVAMKHGRLFRVEVTSTWEAAKYKDPNKSDLLAVIDRRVEYWPTIQVLLKPNH